MSQNYIKVDKQGLEDTFCLVKSVEFSPIYEYVNGEKTANIKGYKVPVLAVEGAYVGEDLELRVPFKPKLSLMQKLPLMSIWKRPKFIQINLDCKFLFGFLISRR